MGHGAIEPGSPVAGLAVIRVRLDIGYDGTGFSGWARQPGQRTVQGTLEDALTRVLNLTEPAVLTVAGRTDAGVHARGQVAHADIPADRWADSGDTAARRLARLLPPDVRVHRLAPAPPGFDARFSAIWRRYAYRVCDDLAMADPLARHATLWYRSTLDVAAMNQAAQGCLGEHDFAAFCRRRDGASTVRTLLRLDWARPGRPWPRRRWWRTRSATTWSARWSARCSRSGTAAGLPAGPPRCSRPGSGTRPRRWQARTGCAWRRSAIPRTPTWPPVPPPPGTCAPGDDHGVWLPGPAQTP